MAKINGLVLPTSLGATLGGAPEDAAKAFMEAATKGLGVVVRDALSAALGEAIGNLGAGPAPDWAKLVTGLAMNMQWSTPPGTSMRSVVTVVAPADAALGGVGFSVGITGSF